MIYHIYKDTDSIGKAVAVMVAAQVLKKPDSVLGFATGSSPIPVYKNLIELYNRGIVDFSKITAFNLDEYCGLEKSHDQSYHYFMMDNLFNYINVPRDKINIPDSLAKDFAKEGEEYDKAIEEAGGIELQLLGIGNNGHIGFNEPCDSFIRETHKVKLTQDTIEANKRFFNSADDVPRYAITMGIGTIMKARAIVFIATGKAKAQAVKNMIKGQPNPLCPASVLQMHSNVTIFLDEDAASLLKS